MSRTHTLSPRLIAMAAALVVIVALSCKEGMRTSAAAPNIHAEVDKDPATPPIESASVAEQMKELKKQVTELQSRLNELQKQRIVAAGTATFNLGAEQDNATFTRVPLTADVAKRLGDDYIVLLTARFPVGGYPFFVPYWKRARDGFDVTLVDVALGPNSTASYGNRNKAYLIDWIVVAVR
jgi:hypothetical protein